MTTPAPTRADLAARLTRLADYFSPPSGAGTDHAISCECNKCEWADDLRAAVCALLDAADARAVPREPTERYRHVKTGGIYTWLGDAIAEWDCKTEFVAYRGSDGQVWIRSRAQFYDGRFERLPQAAPSAQQEPAPAIAPDALTAKLAQLRAFAREHLYGGCKIFSLGDACPCNLCAVDALASALRELAATRAVTGEDADLVKELSIGADGDAKFGDKLMRQAAARKPPSQPSASTTREVRDE